jgi:hypothetical protein
MTTIHISPMVLAVLLVGVYSPIAVASTATPVAAITSVAQGVSPIVPETAQVVADATVPRTGWTMPELQLQEAQVPPDPNSPPRTDTLADLVFVGIPPIGKTNEVVTPLHASTTVDKQRFKGVRVWSATNCIEMRWNDAKATTSLPLETCRANRDK